MDGYLGIVPLVRIREFDFRRGDVSENFLRVFIQRYGEFLVL